MNDQAARRAEIDLNGAWAVRSAGKVMADVEARVPGCIHKDLLRTGKIPDPHYRDNEKQVQWVGETDWTYEREFDVPAALLDYEHVELVCDGLDALATIHINGEALAWTLMRTNGVILDQGRTQAGAAGMSDTVLSRVTVGDARRREGDENLLLWLELAAADGRSSEAVVTLVPPKHLSLLDPQLNIEVLDTTCRLTVQRPALWVWADAPAGQLLRDNFFHMRPGAVRDVGRPGPYGEAWHSLLDLHTGGPS